MSTSGALWCALAHVRVHAQPSSSTRVFAGDTLFAWALGAAIHFHLNKLGSTNPGLQTIDRLLRRNYANVQLQLAKLVLQGMQGLLNRFLPSGKLVYHLVHVSHAIALLHLHLAHPGK